MKPHLTFALTLLLALFGAAISAGAQTTKVRGRVVDGNGEPIPFAAVFFEGTTVGITADLEGEYILQTKDHSATVLTAQLLGYTTQSKTIRPGVFSEVNFVLNLENNELAGSRVKADNRRAKRLLANINANRRRNDPDSHPDYSVKVYTKMELDLTHPDEQLRNTGLGRKMEFVFDYVDTSAVSGVPYLPVMISETVAQKQHSPNPEQNTEVIEANRISGVNPDMNLLSQFTGSLHLKVNFYKEFINAFELEFPSPIMSGALTYYNYYIVDSVLVDGRKTYVVHYHPRPLVSTPAFDGEMRIDAQDFALRSIHANMKSSRNVNWLRDFVLDAEYQRMPDSTWFYASDALYADFSLSVRDSSKMMSFIGNREISYGVPDFSPVEGSGEKRAMVKVAQDAGHKSDEYWNSERPVPLSQKEENVYEMVEQIKTLPIYKNIYTLAYTIVTGYWDIGKVGIGPYFKLASFNNVEGFRPQIGMRTSKEWSQKDRLGFHVAYGTRDRIFKGGVQWEHLWSKEPWRKLTVSGKYDVFQLGSAGREIIEGNILSSIMGGSSGQRLGMMSEFRADYDHELTPSFSFGAGVNLRRYYSNAYVPMLSGATHEDMGSIASNELHLLGRFVKEETVNRGYFIKRHIHSKYPIVSLDLYGGVPGIRNGDFGYFRPELTVQWRLQLPPMGVSRIWFNAGTVVGQVPYPLLHMHEGNNTFIFSKYAFSCLDYFEFASDSWATLFWNHSFMGFFLGKIPLLRRLELREEVSLKATWGALSGRNNGDVMALEKGEIPAMAAPMLFPNGMHALKTPYLEAGVGISNIFRVFRVDAFWRLTHREREMVSEEPKSFTDGLRTLKVHNRNFTVTVGLEFRF